MARINATAKTKTLRNYYELAISIAERVICCRKLPYPASLAKVITTGIRSSKRPPNPKDLNFEAEMNFFRLSFSRLLEQTSGCRIGKRIRVAELNNKN